MIFRAIFAVIFVVSVTGGILAANPTAYIINTSAETISKVDLQTHQVSNNIHTLGTDIDSYPNQIVIRDTLAYVVCSGTDEIQIIDLNTVSTVGWIRFASGENPFWMALLNDTTLYVTLLTADVMVEVDVPSRQVVERTQVGMSPEGVILFDDKAYIAVTAFDFITYTWGQGKVAVYDLIGDTVIAEIPVGKNPQFLALDSEGRIHVTCTGNYTSVPGRVYIIDPYANEVIDSIAINGQPGQIAIGPDNIAYIAAGDYTKTGKVLAYHALTGAILRDAANPIVVDSGAAGVAVFQDSTALVACFGDKLNQLDTSGASYWIYSVGDGPVHLDFDYVPGDANGDWQVNIGDAVYLVTYVFRGGPPPAEPRWRANANGDRAINVGDAVYVVTYIFRGGPRPKVGPTWVR